MSGFGVLGSSLAADVEHALDCHVVAPPSALKHLRALLIDTPSSFFWVFGHKFRGLGYGFRDWRVFWGGVERREKASRVTLGVDGLQSRV